MKRIVVSQRVDVIVDRGERRDALDQRLSEFLWRAGFQAYPVPNLLVRSGRKALSDWLDSISPVGVLLSGGNDIGDSPERDETEKSLCEYSEHHCLPVLGICRGMQFLGSLAGGRLVPVKGHVATRHRLSGVYSGEVNSYHHSGFLELPGDIEVLARSEDGVIEAMRYPRKLWEGWMWHPEREPEFRQEDLIRVQAVFDPSIKRPL